MGNGVTGNTLASEARESRFDPWFPSSAAAHGCGSAFVRRMTRVGTGWRLSCARGEVR